MSDNELEDWRELLTHPAWARLMGFVKSQWGASAYLQKIEQAISHAEDKGLDSIAAVKVVNSVSREITLIMQHPEERIKALDRAQLAQAVTPGRRGRA